MVGRVCTRCVLDESVPGITFDSDGVCSWCRAFDERARTTVAGSPERREKKLEEIVTKVKAAGKGKRYDCVLGVSGGADSSYAALVATRLGLRPLAVHVDNGWNSELAVKNIECVVRGLKLDLVTEVIDWEEFRGVQLSLLRSGVVDLELATDHTITAAMFHNARKFRIKYILTGDNQATEATLPPGWNHRKTDLKNLRAINRAFERAPMTTVPQLSTLGMMFHRRVLKIEDIGILSYTDYVKERAIAELQKELGYRPYEKKHFESIITRFYQGYILPTKFGIDKRKFHYALLIHSGQMTRAEALADLELPTYAPRQQQADKIYVCKKFGLSIAEFDALMAEKPHSHYEWPSDERELQFGIKAQRKLRELRARLPL